MPSHWSDFDGGCLSNTPGSTDSDSLFENKFSLEQCE